MNQRSKRWTITLNNYTNENELRLRSLVGSLLGYLVCGRERGESGTPHLQGYLETTSKISLRSLIRQLDLPRAHLEIARGSLQSNQTYCKKEGDWFELGQPMQQGKRNDLKKIKEKLDAGASQQEIANQYFSKWVTFRKSFQAYTDLKVTPRKWKTIVVCLWGPTGTGKTRFCYDQISERSVWSPGDYEWFDGYSGQEIVIWDDYRGEYPLPLFLKLTDRYPMRVKIKGGFVEWSPRKIYITSNIPPRRWYNDIDDFSFSAFMRRLNIINEIINPIYNDIQINDILL